MANTGPTNFARLTNEEYTRWSMAFWKAQREYSFLTRFLGSGPNSLVQRITEFKQSEKGARAVITLIHDALGDGIAGDRTLEGNEEALRSDDEVIRIDQLRHAHALEGRVADQKSIVNFRKEARDILGYWLGDRIDQLCFHHLSGVDTTQKLNGAPRVGSDFQFLEFNSDIAAPSTNRHFQWDDTNGFVAPDPGNLAAGDTPTYDMLVLLKAKAQEMMLKPVSGTTHGTELFHVFMHPNALAQLKLSDRFHQAWRDAMPSTPANPLFKSGDSIYVDGLAIHSHRHSYHPNAVDTGFGVDANRMLFCGAQALGYAEIGTPYWVEEEKDYKNRPAISVGKMFGFKKPIFHNDLTGTDEDFGVIAVDVAT